MENNYAFKLSHIRASSEFVAKATADSATTLIVCAVIWANYRKRLSVRRVWVGVDGGVDDFI